MYTIIKTLVRYAIKHKYKHEFGNPLLNFSLILHSLVKHSPVCAKATLCGTVSKIIR